MTAARLALVALILGAVLVGATLAAAAPIARLVAVVAAHRCSRPFLPDPVLVPLGATLEPSR